MPKKDQKSFRSILTFRGAFGRPKSTKIGPKTSQNLRRFSRSKKLLFKSVLGPSWAAPGAFWRPPWGHERRFRIEIHTSWWKFMFFMKINFQDAFWTELAPTWPPKRPKMTPRWCPKTTPNRPNIDIKQILFVPGKKKAFGAHRLGRPSTCS